MKCNYWLGAAFVAAMAMMAFGCAEKQTLEETQESAAVVGSGLTKPGEVIEARKGLMDELERLIKPIDSFTVGESADLAELQSTARTMSRMLLTVPYLFPPTTNLYDSTLPTPVTNTLPTVWQNFDAFLALAKSSETAARTMAETMGTEPLRAAARNLRASCDACHALSMKPYVKPEVKPEDLDFDFDSALSK
ncbi:MAG: cytochrome c [Steroidobacteraceae bacterium]